MNKILEIKDLCAEYYTGETRVTVLRNIDLTLVKGECIGIVGESGCGKSTLAASILRLIEKTEGAVRCQYMNYFPGNSENIINLVNLSDEEMRKIRGKNISMIMQDPYSSLNPVIKIGRQLREAYLAHNDSYEKAAGVIMEKLKQVHLPADNTIIDAYPHQLSGGMLQRVSIAAALLNSPDLLIADEPTSNLDVTIQKKIIENLINLKKCLNLSMIFITHNLNLVSEFADRIFILYAGKFAEYGPVEKIFSNPGHPYTKGLLGALPHISKIGERISPIPGFIPSLLELPSGCSFSPRCEVRKEKCAETETDLREIEPGHFVRCLWE